MKIVQHQTTIFQKLSLRVGTPIYRSFCQFNSGQLWTSTALEQVIIIYMSHEMESLKIGQRQGILGAVVMLFSARAIIRHGGSKIGAGLLLLLGCEAASVF